MNALGFALRHPLTIMVAVVAIALGSLFSVNRMRTDVFPNLNQPVIYVAQPYGGMDPAQMEGLITNYYEYAFLFMNGIDHVESRNVQNIALVKLYFHPGTNMAQAVAEAAIYANRAKAFFPPGTVTPFIMSLDASMVPVAYVTLSSESRSIDDLADLMLFRVRPKLASLPGHDGPAAVRRQLALHRREPRSGAAAGLQPVAREGRRGSQQGQHHHAVGQCPHQGPDADRFGQLHRGQSQGSRQHPDQARRQPSICATSARSRTPPTFRPAGPWSTAAARFTCRSSKPPTPRR